MVSTAVIFAKEHHVLSVDDSYRCKEAGERCTLEQSHTLHFRSRRLDKRYCTSRNEQDPSSDLRKNPDTWLASVA